MTGYRARIRTSSSSIDRVATSALSCDWKPRPEGRRDREQLPGQACEADQAVGVDQDVHALAHARSGRLGQDGVEPDCGLSIEFDADLLRNVPCPPDLFPREAAAEHRVAFRPVIREVL